MGLNEWVIIGVIQSFIILLGCILYLYYRNSQYQTRLRALAKQRTSASASTAQQIDAQQPHTKESEDSLAQVLKQNGVLKERIATYEQRVQNLEKFRGLYFTLSEQINEINAIQDSINQKIKDSDLLNESNQDLAKTIQQLENEKAGLQTQLKQIEDQLDVIQESAEAQAGSEDELASITIQKQKQLIAELTQEIADANIQSESMVSIHKSVDQLDEKSHQLEATIKQLEEENEFLADQIQALLKQELVKEEAAQSAITKLESALEEAQGKLDQLNKQYADLESKYVGLANSG